MLRACLAAQRRRISSTATVPSADAAPAPAKKLWNPSGGRPSGEAPDLLGLRLSHENTYLSWSRNGIIATVAAIGIQTATDGAPAPDGSGPPSAHRGGANLMLTAGGGSVQCSSATMGLLGAASSFWILGTAQYLYHLRSLAQVLQLSALRRAWMASHAVVATTCWCGGIAALATPTPPATAQPSAAPAATQVLPPPRAAAPQLAQPQPPQAQAAGSAPMLQGLGQSLALGMVSGAVVLAACRR